jgi:hypothetical protein
MNRPRPDELDESQREHIELRDPYEVALDDAFEAEADTIPAPPPWESEDEEE